MKKLIVLLLGFIFIGNVWTLEIESGAFLNQGYIPAKYSCDSSDISPDISWKDVPFGTKSFALICDDPDAPFKTWVHWVIFNIPAEKRQLPENTPKESVLSEGAVQAVNDFGKIGYAGPCPPQGKSHRYFFKLYALDGILSFSSDKEITKNDVLTAMQGHILAEAKIMGIYER